MRTRLLSALVVVSLVHCAYVPSVFAQDGDEDVSTDAKPQVAIPEGPLTVDPATIAPQLLAKKVTIRFDGASLREVGDWISQQGMPVVFDKPSLEEQGIFLEDTITDWLNDQPLYLMLNRLAGKGLAWSVRDDILHITTIIASENDDTYSVTKTYTVTDLLDNGYEIGDLIDTIQNETPGPWLDLDSEGGSLSELGDVLFVRQTQATHMHIEGLLTALRKHGVRTFILDPPEHEPLRQKLQENVSVDFVRMPLATAIERLGAAVEADIRLDRKALDEEGIRGREPVSLTLADRQLSTVLRVLLADFGLTWAIRDGVLWVTTSIALESDDRFQKTAVFDVRDLCRNESEGGALIDALQNETSGPWMDLDSEGATISFAKVGTMVIRNTESGLDEVRDLLSAYRRALRESKRRDRQAVDPQEVVTRYYRLDETTASDLSTLLPKMIRPESWARDANPGADGTILEVSSKAELRGANGNVVSANASSNALLVNKSVLIIRQSRAVHEEIAELIRRVESGDPDPSTVPTEGMGGGMGGAMGGGFGGGFFSR